MNKTLQKSGALLLAASLFFAACSSGEGQAPASSAAESETAMGRYVETVYPWPEGLSHTEGLMSRPDGSLEMIGSKNETSMSGPWEIYTSSDGGKSWSQKAAPWFSEFADAVIGGADYDEEGNLYLATVTYPPEFEELLLQAMETGVAPPPEAYPPYLLYKVSPDGQVSEIPIDWKIEEGAQQMLVYGLSCAGQERIIVNHYGSYVLYDLQSGQAVYTFLTDGGDPIIYQNIFAVAGEKGIEQYDLTTGETLDTIPFDEPGGSMSLQVSSDGKAIYRCDARGIYRYVLGGSVWERVVDGELSSLGMPSVYIGSFAVQPDGDFLVITTSGNDFVPIHFSFDSSVPSVPVKEMNVYSLYENQTVRQAIGLMQRAHPEMQVRYTVAVDEGGAISASDAIRALNTALLAGKGPDVLLLDSLPIESYIEKGILSDLSQALQTAQASEKLLDNMTGTYQKDGALYALPARFFVPEMWGSEEFIEKAADLSSLAAWAQAAHAENPADRLLYRMEPAQLLEDFYYTCAPAWRAEDGSIRPQEFASFLSDIKRIADTAAEPDLSGMGEWGAYMDFSAPFDFMYAGIYWANGLIKAACGLSGSMEDYSAPDAAAEYLGGGGFNLLAGQAKNVYVPAVILGLNKNSEQQQMGEEFIQLALSKAVQQHNFSDGYPVNEAALLENAQNPYFEGDDGMQAPVFENGEMKILFIFWPRESFMQGILDCISSLDTPCTMDRVLLEMMIDETREYFAGSIPVEQAVSAVVERTQAYLAE
ncbi:MAG: hypothetical protein HFG27_04575 [Provencibacterium sp.]|jgi:ABC-type glycerol-3-phosphate transport system substrate-binding protein|nr:hypothetical protein [Provencibacterium sp.]